MTRKKMVFIVGTRPEAIKMAPVILSFKKFDGQFNVVVCVTGQHEELVAGVNELFDIDTNQNLKLMSFNQTLASFGAKCLSSLDKYIEAENPDWVFVHGDTSSAFYGALAAYYNKIKVAHIEAGLRTNNKYSPFPEEINRVLIGRIADVHFAPTENSRNNLLTENIDSKSVIVTGNTVIDALNIVVDKIENKIVKLTAIPDEIQKSKGKIILITMHRRENFGESIENICSAIKELANTYPSFNFVYPVHPNPNVLEPVNKLLGGIDNIYLIKPLNYVDFVYLMKKSYIIFSDSGGVQEEAPGLGVPVLVLRENTERPEAVKAGTVKVVGTNKENIISIFNELVSNENEYKRMSSAINPYGNGTASEKIVKHFIDEENIYT